jgi:hypothetical protein
LQGSFFADRHTPTGNLDRRADAICEHRRQGLKS